MDTRLLLLWAVALLCLATTTQVACGFNLTIMHTNDFHGRIEETNKHSGRCSDEDAKTQKCFGGSARLKTKIDEIRAKYPNTLLLSAGDQYQGSLLFFVYQGPIMSFFMDQLGYDAMALGNHEFDKGPNGLEPFLDNVTFPVLSCNIDYTDAPQLASVKKSTILKVNGQDIGIIGYTTATTPSVSSPGKVKFNNEITAIKAEVAKLTKKGVNKIIALGHAGYDVDMEIAKQVPGLDLVVGGHTNTFLYTGKAPHIEEPLGLYPTVIRNSAGKDVLVVQDYAYGKYLGFLQVDFDQDGKITAWNGNPILMDKTVPQDKKITALIKTYLPKVEAMKASVIGKTYVHLNGDRTVCRVRECNMGNLITDAMVHQNLKYSDSDEWTPTAIALFAGGGIRTSIAKGNITVTDLLGVMPFGNTIDHVELTGKILWDVLEHSASIWVEKGALFGGFLQMSGLRVVYDMEQKVGRRVLQVHARCADCDIPEFKPLNVTKTYKIIMASFTIAGGDGYTMIRDNVGKSHTIGDIDSDLMLNYMQNNSPITSGLEGRIQFAKDVQDKALCTAKGDGASATKSSLLLLTTSSIFVILRYL